MTTKAYEQAKALIEEIDNMQAWRERILDDLLFKKDRIPPEGVLLAARDAMLAIVDENIDALKTKLDSL